MLRLSAPLGPEQRRMVEEESNTRLEELEIIEHDVRGSKWLHLVLGMHLPTVSNVQFVGLAKPKERI